MRNYGVYFDKSANLLLFNAIDTSRATYVFDATLPEANSYFDDLLWHFVGVTWDQTNHQARIYIDGILKASASGTTVPMLMNQETLKIGAATAGRYYINASMDEILFFGKAESSFDIWELYRETKVGICR